MRFALGLLFVSLSSFAAGPCPDLNGVFGNYDQMGIAVRLEQTGCRIFKVTQFVVGRTTVTDEIIMDGQYRVLNSMPQFLTAYTYDSTYLIGNAKDVKTGDFLRIFQSSLDENGNLRWQTIKFDGRGNVLGSRTDILKRCPAGVKCERDF